MAEPLAKLLAREKPEVLAAARRKAREALEEIEQQERPAQPE